MLSLTDSGDQINPAQALEGAVEIQPTITSPAAGEASELAGQPAEEAAGQPPGGDAGSRRRILIGSQRDPAAYRARTRRDWEPVADGGERKAEGGRRRKKRGEGRGERGEGQAASDGARGAGDRRPEQIDVPPTSAATVPAQATEQHEPAAGPLPGPMAALKRVAGPTLAGTSAGAERGDSLATPGADRRADRNGDSSIRGASAGA